MITITAFDNTKENYGTDLPLSAGIYLHGDAEDIAGFDLCNVSEIPNEHGLFCCEIVIRERKHHGYMYYWRANGCDRGLVVFEDDLVSQREAEELYHTRAKNI